MGGRFRHIIQLNITKVNNFLYLPNFFTNYIWSPFLQVT